MVRKTDWRERLWSESKYTFKIKIKVYLNLVHCKTRNFMSLSEKSLPHGSVESLLRFLMVWELLIIESTCKTFSQCVTLPLLCDYPTPELMKCIQWYTTICLVLKWTRKIQSDLNTIAKQSSSPSVVTPCLCLDMAPLILQSHTPAGWHPGLGPSPPMCPGRGMPWLPHFPAGAAGRVLAAMSCPSTPGSPQPTLRADNFNIKLQVGLNNLKRFDRGQISAEAKHFFCIPHQNKQK